MKLLITGGCSFSQVQGQPDPNLDEDKKVWPNCTWPLHLEEALKPEFHTHTGMSAAGNEIISQRIINKVNKALKDGFSPNDMLVGIMWSAADRFSLMSSNFKKNIHNLSHCHGRYWLWDDPCRKQRSAHEAIFSSGAYSPRLSLA